MTTTIEKPYMLTRDGLESLQAELEELTTTGREKIAERLARAFDDGQDDDFVDNAELEKARQEQAFLEGRVQTIQGILRNYEVIDENRKRSKFVQVGDWITVSEVGDDLTEKYQLVGAAEADPLTGRISYESPLGAALLGSVVGDVVEFDAPGGTIQFEIKKKGRK